MLWSCGGHLCSRKAGVQLRFIPYHFMVFQCVSLSNSESICVAVRGSQLQSDLDEGENRRKAPSLLLVKTNGSPWIFPLSPNNPRNSLGILSVVPWYLFYVVTAMARKRKPHEEDAVPPLDNLDAWASHPRLLRHVRCLVASKNPLLGFPFLEKTICFNVNPGLINHGLLIRGVLLQ